MSNLTLWTRHDPFVEFDTLVRNAFGTPARRGTSFVPAAEITTDDADTVIRIELPGVDVANDVTVEVENGTLVVHGQRRDEHADDADGRRLREVRYGSFRRSFKLPSQTTADDVSASYESGVLRVRIAGTETKTASRRIAIDTGATA